MAAYFFDSSAILKRYVREPGTGFVLGLTNPGAGNVVSIARITEVEVTAALARRRRGGLIRPSQAVALLARFTRDVASLYEIIEITVGLLRDAAVLADRCGLRAYDAVQLAAAVRTRDDAVASGISPPVLVCSDRELNVAAAAEGLAVEDPAAHP